MRKYKNNKLRKTKTSLKKKLLKIDNGLTKNNIHKKYRKRKNIIKSFLLTTYLFKHFYDVLKLIMTKFLYFVQNLKIQIIFPNRRKNNEYISNLIKKINKKICYYIIKYRKKTHNLLFNDFKEFIKATSINYIFASLIIIVIKVDILILLFQKYYLYNRFK